MKIYKIAQGIPAGSIELTIEFDVHGNLRTEVTGRGPDTSCQKEDDSMIIREILDGIAEISEEGKTPEGYRATPTPKVPVKAPEKAKPIMQKPQDARQKAGLGF